MWIKRAFMQWEERMCMEVGRLECFHVGTSAENIRDHIPNDADPNCWRWLGCWIGLAEFFAV